MQDLLTKPCEACGRVFSQRENERPGRFAGRRYCSRACVSDSQRKPGVPIDLEPPKEYAREMVSAAHCPYCGKGPFRVVAGHVWRSHRITKKELRDLLEVPYSRSICDPEHSDLMRTLMIETNRVQSMRGTYDPTGRRPQHGPGALTALREAGRRSGIAKRKIPLEDYASIADRIAQGESTNSVARDYGVSGSGVRAAMKHYQSRSVKALRQAH